MTGTGIADVRRGVWAAVQVLSAHVPPEEVSLIRDTPTGDGHRSGVATAGSRSPGDPYRALEAAEALRRNGIHAVAVTMVDNSGVARVKAMPVERLAQAAANGIGAPPVFDFFGGDDSIAPGGSPVGDLRMLPDLAALRSLAAMPGWAWAPAERVALDGSSHPGCQRAFAHRQQERAAAAGLELKMAFETEWVLDAGKDGRLGPDGVAGEDRLVPVTTGPAYGMGRLVDVAGFSSELLAMLAGSGVEVVQLHPEYAPSQMELSVAPKGPVGASDEVVVVRQTLRAVAARHGWRVSLSPAFEPEGVGNGAHLHMSLWRGSTNLLAPVMSSATIGIGAASDEARCRPSGLDPVGEAWLAGILDALPALMAVVAPSAASYLRLQPQRWAAPWRCWGRENREAALRLVAGSAWGGPEGANVELKVVDASANPYLVTGAVLAAGLDGVRRSLTLPQEVTVDPALLDDDGRKAAGVMRLPRSLGEALDELDRSEVLRSAMGDQLANAFSAVRRAELERFAASSDEEIAVGSRWVW